MSHKGHPIIGVVIVALGVFAWRAHVQAEDQTSYVARKFTVNSTVPGYSDRDDAVKAFHLAMQNDYHAMFKLASDDMSIRLAINLEKKNVVVEKQFNPNHQKDGGFVCLRPDGEPDCRWTAVFFVSDELGYVHK